VATAAAVVVGVGTVNVDEVFMMVDVGSLEMERQY